MTFLSTVSTCVLLRIVWIRKCLVTDVTLVWFLSSVSASVRFETAWESKFHVTDCTLVWFLASVSAGMSLKMAWLSKWSLFSVITSIFIRCDGRVNALLQRVHWYGFSLVGVRVCRCRWDNTLTDASQMVHWHDFSPVWVWMCFLSWLKFKKNLPHDTHSWDLLCFDIDSRITSLRQPPLADSYFPCPLSGFEKKLVKVARW